MEKIVDKEQKAKKKTYDSPKVIRFGGVTNLTQQNFNSSVSDAGNNRMGMASF